MARFGNTLALLIAATLAGCGESPRAFWPGGVRRFEGAGGVRHGSGLWTYWYPDGQLRERGTYAGGHRVGVWSQWYLAGQRASRGERVWVPEHHASERHGIWTTWHENGQKRTEGTYDLGERDGHWDAWNADGSVDVETAGEYRDGQRVE